jgi:hypothetical protein
VLLRDERLDALGEESASIRDASVVACPARNKNFSCLSASVVER